MANHRDDQPRPESKEPASAPETPAADDPKKTRLARKGSVPTMLAPQEEQPQAEPAAPAEAAVPTAAPAAETPDAKRTRLARKSSVPTMLAPSQELEAGTDSVPLAQDAPAADQPAAPAPAAPPLPNLSLDEASGADAAEDLEVIDYAEPAPAEDELEVLEPVAEEAPNSDVLAAELLRDEQAGSGAIVLGSSAVLAEEADSGAHGPESPPPAEAAPPQADSDVSSHLDIVVAPGSDVVQLSSDVMVAEPVGEAESGHDVLELVEGETPGSDVKELSSDVLLAATADESAGDEEILEEIEAAAPASDVVELGSEAVLSEEQAAEEQPASAQQPVELAPESGIILEEVPDAEEAGSGVAAESGSAIVLEEVVESSESPSAEEVLEVEPAAASDVVAMTSDVLMSEDTVQPRGDVDDALMAAAEEVSARELASDIFSAEDEVSLPKPPPKRPRVQRQPKAPEEGPLPEDEHDVFSGETVTMGPDDVEPAARSSSPSELVLEGEEARGSSAVQWEEVEAASGVKETEKTKAGANLEATVPFQDVGKGKISSAARKKSDVQDLVTVEDLGELATDSATRSGVDPLAEALESGVNIGKKEPSDVIKLEADEAEDGSTVNLGGPSGKAKAKVSEVEEADLAEASTEMDTAALADAEKADDVDEALLEAIEEQDAETVEAIEEVVEEAEEVAEVSEAEEAAEAEDVDELVDAEEATELEEAVEAEDAVEAEEALEADDLVAAEALEAEEDVEEPVVAGRKAKHAAEEEAEAALFTEDVDAVVADEADEALEVAEADEAEEALEIAEAYEADEALAVEADEAELAEAEAEAVDFEDEEPLLAGKKKKRFPALLDEEEMAEPFEDVEDATPVSRKKKKRVWGDDEDDGGVATLTRAPKPKYGRRWLGGTFLGLLLAAGGAGAVWYFAPDTLDDLTQNSPNAKERPKAEAGRSDADFKKLTGDLAKLEDRTKELEGSLAAETKKLKDAETLIDTKVDEVGKKLAAVTKDRDAARKTLDEATVAMLSEKLLSKKDDFYDTATLKKTIEELGKIKIDYTGMNAKLKEIGIDKTGLEGLVDLEMKRDEKVKEIAAINAVLIDARKKEFTEAVMRSYAALGIDPRVIIGSKEFEAVLADFKPKAEDLGRDGLATLVKLRDLLHRDRDLLDGLVSDAYRELTLGAVDASPDARAAIVAAARLARIRGESPLAVPLTGLATGVAGLPSGTDRALGKSVDLTKLAIELAYFKLREPLIVGPEKKVDLHILLLQDRARNKAEDLTVPTKEAAWLLSEAAAASPEVKAKALYVFALADRNQGVYGGAIKTLRDVTAMAKDMKAPGLWADLAQLSLRELTDPDFYYLRRALERKAEFAFKSAVDEIDTGLKAMPDEPRLFVHRAWTRVEGGKHAGRIPPEEVPNIRADLALCDKDERTRALSAYVGGLLDEKLGYFTKAETGFRNALALHRDEDELAFKGLYLEALARILQTDRSGEVTAPEPKKKGDVEKKVDDKKADDKKADDKDAEKKDAEKAKDEEAVLLSPLHSAILAVLVVAVEPPFDDEDEEAKAMRAKLEESIKSAKELIELGKELVKLGEKLADAKKVTEGEKTMGRGYMLWGKAQTKLGERNEGLRKYALGLKLFIGGDIGGSVVELVETHPALGYPDSAARPNMYLAEDHYGRGLHLYWSRSHLEAEKHFRQAIYWFKDDARFHYFYGLAQLAQKGDKKKREAGIYALEMGSKMEAKNLPTSVEINAALERVQGELRSYLNRYRLSAVTGIDLDEKKVKVE